MGIARLARGHRETLFPRRKKVHLQKMIRGSEVVDPGQAHFLYQAVLQRFEQSFDPPFRLRTVRRDPFDPQLAERSSEMRTGFLSPQLFSQRRRSRRPEDAIFIGVMRQRTSVAPQPFPESPQVLFRSVVFCKTRIETAGGVVDHRNQLASRPALLHPTKRGAILHAQLAKTGAALPPHMDGLYALCARPSPSTCAASRGSPPAPPGPSARRPASAQSPRSVGAPASKSAARNVRRISGSMAVRVIHGSPRGHRASAVPPTTVESVDR